MTDRSFPVVDRLIRRAERVAAGRPDPLRILSQTIGLAGVAGVDPYAILGVLVEGLVHTLGEHIPAERQAEAVATLRQLLEERLKVSGIGGDGG